MRNWIELAVGVEIHILDVILLRNMDWMGTVVRGGYSDKMKYKTSNSIFCQRFCRVIGFRPSI